MCIPEEGTTAAGRRSAAHPSSALRVYPAAPTPYKYEGAGAASANVRVRPRSVSLIHAIGMSADRERDCIDQDGDSTADEFYSNGRKDAVCVLGEERGALVTSFKEPEARLAHATRKWRMSLPRGRTTSIWAHPTQTRRDAQNMQDPAKAKDVGFLQESSGFL
ncbi:hypothetical protein C8J57DRAFT_1458237, partial [Mycena rebaudengoi]